MSQGTPAGAELDARGMRFAVVAARWNAEIVEQLLQGAQAALAARHAENVRVYRCSGAFELAPLCARVARKGSIDGIVALGCLIRGGTDHYRLLADEVTRGLGALALEGGTNPRPLAVASACSPVRIWDRRRSGLTRSGATRAARGPWPASSRCTHCARWAASGIEDQGARVRAAGALSARHQRRRCPRCAARRALALRGGRRRHGDLRRSAGARRAIGANANR